MIKYVCRLKNTYSVSVVAVNDMDGLKYINDTFGHIEGDMCLKRLANVNKDCGRKNVQLQGRPQEGETITGTVNEKEQ